MGRSPSSASITDFSVKENKPRFKYFLCNIKSDTPIRCDLPYSTEAEIDYDFLTNDDEKVKRSDKHMFWKLNWYTSSVFLNENKETLDALGSLMVSKLELSVTPTDGIQDLIVGNWAVLKVTPVEPEFFDDFKLSRFN